MKEGKLIVVEGACDGIGKTTQYNMLCERFKADGYQIANHHFPSYNTHQGAPVEKYLKGEYGQINELSPYFINSLYAIDRGITWQVELKKLYEQGQFILLDRYTTSSLIYQSALIEDLEQRKKFIDYVIDFEYHKLGIKEPDNVIFLHAPFELVTKMRNARNEKDNLAVDIHERNLDYMQRVYENAMFISDYLAWNKVECSNGNQMREINDIHQEVYKLVRKK